MEQNGEKPAVLHIVPAGGVGGLPPPPGLGFDDTESITGSQYTATTSMYDTQSEYSRSQYSQVSGRNRGGFRRYFARGKKSDMPYHARAQGSRPRLGTDYSPRSRLDTNNSQFGMQESSRSLLDEGSESAQRKIYPPKGPVPQIPQPGSSIDSPSKTKNGGKKRWTLRGQWLPRALTLDRKQKPNKPREKKPKKNREGRNRKQADPNRPRRTGKDGKPKKRHRMLRSQASLFILMVKKIHIPPDDVEKYLVTFAKEGVDEDLFKRLGDDDLKELGLVLGHRRKVLDYFKAWNQVEV